MTTPPPAKRRKSEKQQKDSEDPPTSSTPAPTTAITVTEPTIDEHIFPNAVFKNYEEFDKAYNTWRKKFNVPFRVASSEALRTENGSISEQFRYRYVVFHCARFGAPRMRGGGKRPNQHYLPCNCQAMLRLNFSYTEQCLKITSLETRHTNHTLDKDLYEKMMEKEQRRKSSTVRSNIFLVKSETSSSTSSTPEPSKDAKMKKKKMPVKTEIHSDDEEVVSEHTNSQSQSPVHFDTSTPPGVVEGLQPPASLVVGQKVLTNLGGPFQLAAPFIQQQYHQLQQPMVGMQQQNALRMWETINQLAPATIPPYSNYNNYTFNFGQSLPPPPLSSSSLSQTTTSSEIGTTSSQISPISTDENDAPASSSAFMSLNRPIPLRPSENRAFNEMLTAGGSSRTTSPFPKSEIDGILRSTSQMLHDVNLPADVLENRMKQLNNLISQWSHT